MRRQLFNARKLTNCNVYQNAVKFQFYQYSKENLTAQSSFLDRAEVERRVIQVVQKHEKVDEEKVFANSLFVKDLGLDSLDASEIVMEIEDEFQITIPDEDAFKLMSVEQCVDFIAQSPMAK